MGLPAAIIIGAAVAVGAAGLNYKQSKDQAQAAKEQGKEVNNEQKALRVQATNKEEANSLAQASLAARQRQRAFRSSQRGNSAGSFGAESNPLGGLSAPSNAGGKTLLGE